MRTIRDWARRVFILVGKRGRSLPLPSEETPLMIEALAADPVDDYPHRRRASDRARERAGRAAYLGDRAGLLIATGTAERLMSSRAEADRAAGRGARVTAKT
jgi:hypothetical protein